MTAAPGPRTTLGAPEPYTGAQVTGPPRAHGQNPLRPEQETRLGERQAAQAHGAFTGRRAAGEGRQGAKDRCLRC